MQTFKREFYRIRFPANAGQWNEYYRSNSGTTEWGSLSKVKAIITRGQPQGYKGRTLVPFDKYEIQKFTETVQQEVEVVQL